MHIRRGLIHKLRGLAVGGQQAFYFLAKRVVPRANYPQISGAILFRALERSLKNLPNLRPSLGRQEFLP